jgi:hypothetical protein
MKSRKVNIALISMLAAGGLFGVWALAALVGGLHRVDWQVTELIRQYMVAIGVIQPLHTLVDFYTHIKGIEYLICVAFLVVFPVFVKYLEKQDTEVRTRVRSDN